MSRFRILRVNNTDPEKIGKNNRFLYAIYLVLPSLFLLSFNFGHFWGLSSTMKFLISTPFLAVIYFIILKKMRSTIDNLKSIGELEITQSCIKRRLGDIITEYHFQSIKEIKLIKHIPATRLRDSKSRYFSYILKIAFRNKPEVSFVVADRSVDHNHGISLADTMRTLKKIVHFDVIIEL